MKNVLSLLLKIFLIVLLVFLVLASIPVPALILPTIWLYSLIAFLWFVNKKPKSISENVKVISKTTQFLILYITFEFIDGTRKTMRSTVQLYGSILEGEIGTLSYREYKNHAYIIDFRRDKER